MLLLLLMSVVLVFLFVYQNEKAIVDKVSESNINGHMLKKKCYKLHSRLKTHC